MLISFRQVRETHNKLKGIFLFMKNQPKGLISLIMSF